MSGPVLVTGAGGFIGRAVVARLARAGLPVRAGLRRGAEARPGVERAACDLDVPSEVAAACAGAATIVHAAGRATATMTAHLRTLLDAAGRAGVGRVVLFSSIAVYGDRAGEVGEDDPPGRLDAYGAAKRACERMLRAWAGEDPGHRRAAILRPGIVYGRGSDLWIERPAAALRAGVLGHLGPRGEGIAALIHVDDVAEATRAAVAALDRPSPLDGALNLVGPDTPTWNGYFAALSESLGHGHPRPIGRTRLALLRAGALPAKAAARLGLPAPDALRRVPAAGELRLFARAARYETARAAGILGFRGSIALAEGLAASLPEAGLGLDRPYAPASAKSAKAPAKAASPHSIPAAR